MDNATCLETSTAQYSTQFRFEEHAVSNFSYQVGGRAEIVSLNLGEVSFENINSHLVLFFNRVKF